MFDLPPIVHRTVVICVSLWRAGNQLQSTDFGFDHLMRSSWGWAIRFSADFGGSPRLSVELRSDQNAIQISNRYVFHWPHCSRRQTMAPWLDIPGSCAHCSSHHARQSEPASLSGAGGLRPACRRPSTLKEGETHFSRGTCLPNYGRCSAAAYGIF